MTAEREERTQSPSPGPDADEGAGLCAGKGERAFQAEGPNEGPKLRPPERAAKFRNPPSGPSAMLGPGGRGGTGSLEGR